MKARRTLAFIADYDVISRHDHLIVLPDQNIALVMI